MIVKDDLIMDPLDENKLILGCLSSGRPKGRKKLKMTEIDPICDGDDAITRMAVKHSKYKKNRQDFKYKATEKWSGLDFIKYIDSLLSQYGSKLKSSGVRDQDLINKLYDLLLIKIGESMNNTILKEYIEWWIASKISKYQYKSIYIQSFSQDRFINEYMQDIYKSSQPIPIKTKAVNESEIYNAGGISSLLLSRGIVIAYNFLKKQHEPDIISKINKVLMSSSKGMLVSIMDMTFKNAPYDKSCIVDFLSIAKQSLNRHNVTKYLNADYKTLFQGE